LEENSEEPFGRSRRVFLYELAGGLNVLKKKSNTREVIKRRSTNRTSLRSWRCKSLFDTKETKAYTSRGVSEKKKETILMRHVLRGKATP